MTLTLGIDNVRSGWVDVELSLGRFELSFSASAVANDPLRQLAELALFVARGQRGTASAVFWLEPAGYELCATNDSTLVLSVRYSKTAFASLSNPYVVHQQGADPRAVSTEILRSLRALLPGFVEAIAANPRAWYHPFPDDLVVQLDTAVRF